MKAYVGADIDPYFLDLYTSWRWVVSFTHWPLYPRGKSPRYPLDGGVGWTPEPVWTTRRRENSWPYRDSNSDPPVVQPVASRYKDYVIPDPNFTYRLKYKFVSEIRVNDCSSSWKATQWRQWWQELDLGHVTRFNYRQMLLCLWHSIFINIKEQISYLQSWLSAKYATQFNNKQFVLCLWQLIIIDNESVTKLTHFKTLLCYVKIDTLTMENSSS
jgi:hypothetical protein